MMIIVAQLRVSGFFELATRFATQRAHGPLVLLTAIVIVTGFFSSFVVNDAICLVMAPLVIDVTRALRRNPGPYLLSAKHDHRRHVASALCRGLCPARSGGGGRARADDWCHRPLARDLGR